MYSSVKVQKIHGWRKLLLYPLVLCLKLFTLTIRVRPTAEMDAILNNCPDPTVVAFWHQNLFLIWKINYMLKTTLPMYGLISPSTDGAWLSAFFQIFNIRNIRGSSKRGGLSALKMLQQKLKEGANVAITPDGPRGPAKHMKRGVPLLALQTQTDIFLIGMHFSSYWKLHTWDGFIIPKPFSKVIVNGKKIPYEEFKDLSVDALRTKLEQALDSL